MKTHPCYSTAPHVVRSVNRRDTRRGSMLVQCVVIMMMFSMLMTIAGTALFRMFRQQVNLSASITQSAVLARLAREFRNDAHVATEAKLVGNAGHEIVLRNGDEIVTWAAGPQGLTRTTRKGQTTDAGVPETTRLIDVEIHFEVMSAPASGLSRVRMTLNPVADARFHVLTPTTVDAAVGTTRRFEKPADAS